jgi:general nucleoside transport system ATP-binding protein
MTDTDLAVRITSVKKSFGACEAIRAASLELRIGEIHALCGENGAGKSTLMRLLAGLISPDRGTIEVFGRNVTGWSTARAIDAGVGMVHQHFMLVPTLTVAENLVLGREPKRGLRIDLEKARNDVDKHAKETGLEVPSDRLVGELSVGIAQRVEILKVLHRGARVLILDEPTAVLSPPEVAELFSVLRKLKGEGTTIVLITHKLDEVMAVSDRITIIRRGVTQDVIETKGASPASIARAMVGRDVDLTASHNDAAIDSDTSRGEDNRAPLFEVRGLVAMNARGSRAIDDITFSVHPGEIFGIAGVEGNGQTELVSVLAGLSRATSGSITLDGRAIETMTVRERSDAGLAHIAEDRQSRGLVLDYTIAENLILGRQRRFEQYGLIDRDRMLAFAEERIRTFDIRPTDPNVEAIALSGGNQQKIVVARETGHGFNVLIAAQPTRGVDVGAIELIHGRLREARNAEKAIVLVSAELNEILALSDRIAVLYRGRLVTVLPRSEATAAILGPYMTGATEAA